MKIKYYFTFKTVSNGFENNITKISSNEILYLFSKNPFRTYYILKNMFSNMAINSTQRIIKKINISVTVNSACKTHSLLLPTTQIYSLKLNIKIKVIIKNNDDKNRIHIK